MTPDEWRDVITSMRNACFDHASADTIGSAELDGISGASLDIINDYLSMFIKPEFDASGEQICACCNRTLTGSMLGTFVLRKAAIQDGTEGKCSVCEWPAKSEHTINDKAGNTIQSGEGILQYHPNMIIEGYSNV